MKDIRDYIKDLNVGHVQMSMNDIKKHYIYGFEILDNFKASSYQKYQGEKLANRFNAYSYWILSKAMDSHNIARGRDNIIDVLNQIKTKTTVIGISSDLLFPPSEQKFIAENIPNGHYLEIDSPFGHDGFLVELEKLNRIFEKILAVEYSF